jgi:3-hydroxyisobutyrate dehydrogenase-like beta-hydroxyacid dehydrogenase
MKKWGFVGLGQMGEPMAVSLARSGTPLTVLHRHPKGRDAAIAAGAAIAEDTKALAALSDIIGICVSNEAQVDVLLQGEAGLYAQCRPGTLLVIHSTISPEACRRIAREAAEFGLSVLDAPVTGLTVRAEIGGLTIYVGGKTGDLEEARPGLSAMGSTILHMGGVGMGQVTKILNNAISIPTIALIAEAIELGTAAGIDQDALMKALQAGSADSFTLRNFKWFQTIWLSAERGGVEDTARRIGKDLDLALKLARDNSVDLPMAGVALSTLPQVVVRTVQNSQ